MQSSTSLRVSGYLTGAVGVVLLAWTVALRIGSRWPLEWMEGASLQHAIRVAHGLPLYGLPTSEFIPYLYPPLAYVPVAAGVWLLGPSLWVGRLVSVLALAGSLACVFVTVRRSACSAAVGCWAVGVYALGFGYDGAFADLVRVDSVFILLVLVGVERLSARSYATGLIWLVLSCFAKQHGVFFLAAAAIGLLLTEGRRVGRQLTAAAGAFLAATAALQANSGGYYLKYTASVASGHSLEPTLLLSYFAVDVALYLPVLTALTLAGMWRTRSSARARWSEALADNELTDATAPGSFASAAGLVPKAVGAPRLQPPASDAFAPAGSADSSRAHKAAPHSESAAAAASPGASAPAARAASAAPAFAPAALASTDAPRADVVASDSESAATAASRSAASAARAASGGGVDAPGAASRSESVAPLQVLGSASPLEPIRRSPAAPAPASPATVVAAPPHVASPSGSSAASLHASPSGSPAAPALEPTAASLDHATPPTAPGLPPALLSLLLLAGLAASALGRAHPGGFDNVRMPGFAVLVISAAVALPATWAAASRPLRALLLAALVLQPLMLLQLPAAHAPTRAQAAQFQALTDALRRCGDGDLSHSVALDHGLLTPRPFLHTMALSDLRQSRDAQPLAAAGTQALIDALHSPDAPASLAVSATFPELERALREHYDACAHLPPMHFATGYRLRLTTVYRSRERATERLPR